MAILWDNRLDAAVTDTPLELIILGSGTSTGVPAIGCACPVCTSNDPRNRRTRCSALIRYRGRNLLIDTAPDLRQQALREGLSRVDAVLYTHAHADHTHGIDDLRSFNHTAGGPIPIYGDRRTLDGLHRSFRYIFGDATDGGWRPELEPHRLEEPAEIAGLPVVPVPLLHGERHVQGYRIGPLAYLVDCSGLPPGARELLGGLELLVLDGLRHRPHASHLTIAQAVALAQELGARRTLLTHLSHDVDFASDGARLPAGIALAYDGQRVTLDFA